METFFNQYDNEARVADPLGPLKNTAVGQLMNNVVDPPAVLQQKVVNSVYNSYGPTVPRNSTRSVLSEYIEDEENYDRNSISRHSTSK
jgi:hypothetical protein